MAETHERTPNDRRFPPLDMLEARMTPAQIAEAQRLATEWREAQQ